ncbi:MAG: fumarylacetoacetate hydrolase family protein [Candidatus Marinimicrobia bacterium]|nr:fumarylacetoacetate hydrolase family protein [Candidatus Neomarinimicrobiota bacterium]
MITFHTDAIFQDGRKIPIRNIYCVGRNYRDHAKELNNPIPKEPLYFQKSTASIAQSNQITIPKETEIHHELELVLCLGKDVFDPVELDIENDIAGFTIGLDLTDRTSQSELKANGKPWFWAKSFKNSSILGPFYNNGLFPLDKDFVLKKNGIPVQTGRVNDMIFSIEYLLKRLVSRVPLLCGDIVFTGTPSGVGQLQTGDILDIIHGDEELYSITIL